MPTKVEEPCPKCGVPTLPTDAVSTWDSELGPVPWRQWRYECAQCDWTWANAAQRAHNETEYAQARRFVRQRGWGG